MYKIKGRYVDESGKVASAGAWTVEEIAKLLMNGHQAMLLLSNYFINNKKYIASALTLFPEESIPVLEGDKILIPASFRRYMLSEEFKDGNPDDLVTVTCVVDISDMLFITIAKVKKVNIN